MLRLYRLKKVTVINFCHDLGLTQTLGKLQKNGRKCSRSLVFNWYGRLHEGRTSITDDLQKGGQHETAHH